MKERPILFSGPMVQAILDGRKTQTRRVVALSNSTVLGRHDRQMWDRLVWDDDANPVSIDPGPDPFGTTGYQYLHVPFMEDGEALRARVRPRVKAGDRLWVRETWAAVKDADSCKPSEFSSATYYRADAEDGRGYPTGAIPLPGDERGKWRPSIHMPRWASRIDLLVTGVRVERLQDIIADDCRSEGHPMRPALSQEVQDDAAKDWFMDLWQSINGPGSWQANPWVWVVEFKRVEKGGAQ